MSFTIIITDHLRRSDASQVGALRSQLGDVLGGAKAGAAGYQHHGMTWVQNAARGSLQKKLDPLVWGLIALTAAMFVIFARKKGVSTRSRTKWGFGWS